MVLDSNTMSKKNQILKKERFKKVASKRVQKILDNFESLSKCSNRNNYDYTDEDVNKMLKTIKEQVRNLELCFSDRTKNKTKTFEF